MLEYYQLYLSELGAVPTFYAYPKKEGPFPTVLYLHSHGGNFSVGKGELTHGASYLASPSFAEVLTGMGCAVRSIDAWGFEEREGISKSELFKQFLLTGKVLWGMRVYDATGLIDYLEARKGTDTQRIAATDLPMGGLLGWWIAVLDPRVKVCVDLAAQVDIEILLLHRRLDRHELYYYVPNLLTAYIMLAIQEKITPCPRPSLARKNDTMCLDEDILKLKKGLDKKYQSMGSPENFSSFSLTSGHIEVQETKNIWEQFIEEHL